MPSKLRVLVFAMAVGLATAVTTLSDDYMGQLLNAGGKHLAWLYAPVWFFSQAMEQIPCIPTWAFNSGTEVPYDTYDTAHKTPGAETCGWPNVGCKCRHPGVKPKNQCAPFPIYYTYNRCGNNNDEIRVAYNLFFQKDGASGSGHPYDWERVIIIHRKGTNGYWEPYSIAMSQHSGYDKRNWDDIQNTLTTDQAVAGNGPTPNGVTYEDHPKVYVAWSKHAMFDDRNTGWNDPLSQSTDNAFRGQDWWRFVDEQYFIRADDSSEAGRAIKAANWGEAASNPVNVHWGLCDV